VKIIACLSCQRLFKVKGDRVRCEVCLPRPKSKYRVRKKPLRMTTAVVCKWCKGEFFPIDKLANRIQPQEFCSSSCAGNAAYAESRKLHQSKLS
jgi:hypothetical protein